MWHRVSARHFGGWAAPIVCSFIVAVGLSGCGGSSNPTALPTASTSRAGSAASVTPPTIPETVSAATPASASATVAATGAVGSAVAPTSKGPLNGFLEAVNCTVIEGWAFDSGQPDAAMSVTILDGSTAIGVVTADIFRQDLLDAKIGNGKHAFRFQVPPALKDKNPRTISAKITSSDFTLKNSPKSLTC